MTEFEAASFYGDYTILRDLMREIMFENDQAMWVQLELFT